MERIEDIPYLSRKATDSNLNSPQCVRYRCRDISAGEASAPSESIPFAVNLCASSPAQEEKDCVNLDISLVNAL